jgi:preprotein translocase subunit SecE
MGRLKRKKPISTRGRKAKERKKIANSDETLKKKGATKGDISSQSNNNGEKLATILRKTSPKAGKQISVVKEPAFWVKTRQFLQEVIMELKRVTWPSRKETIASTAVVIILVLIISFFLGMVDFGLSSLVGFVLQ